MYWLVSIGRPCRSNHIIATPDFESEGIITASTAGPQKCKHKVDTSFKAGNTAYNKKLRENQEPHQPSKRAYGHDDKPKEFIEHVLAGAHELRSLCDSLPLINDDAA